MVDGEFLYSSEQIRRAEQVIARTNGFPLFDLMVKAGKVVFDRACLVYPDSRHWLIACGKGNNGGDGYIVATLALEAGHDVTVIEVPSNSINQGDAAKARQQYLTAGGQIFDIESDWSSSINPDLIIDALLGTGIQGTVKPLFSRVINILNKFRAPIIAVDLPSGLNADNGMAHGSVVIADHTVCFIGIKTGLVTGQARQYVGNLTLERLGMSESLLSSVESPIAHIISCQQIIRIARPRISTAHKGDNGRLLLIGGELGMLGAIRLASAAALRAGAGLVKACVNDSALLALQTGIPELMASGWSTFLPPTQQWSDVVVIGPGLGQSDDAVKILQQITSLNYQLPMVIDADGLNYLALQHQQDIQIHRDNWILTPHPGEAARLLNCSISSVEDDRYAAVRKLQQTYGGVVVLKGAGSLVFDGEQMFVCTRGNPGMASGGMGDVLAGLAGSYLAQGYSLLEASLMAVHIHSMSADKCAKRDGEIGLLASDLLSEIRYLTNFYAQNDSRIV
ncbi:NAD(P)H-hydrate dehydratase [Vibrio sp. FNV 38]|nr:NAD(P)H-hydrate dehydratase [Vibrio sp. FNV 38]